MKERYVVVHTLVAVVIFLCIICISGCSMIADRIAGRVVTSASKTQQQVPEVTVPKEPAPANTLVAFPFRSAGDADAKYYGIGFSKALASRLYCANTCLTQQPGASAVCEQLAVRKQDVLKAPSDELAQSIGKSLGVRYSVTGDLKLAGNNVSGSVCVFDLSKPGKKSVFQFADSVSNLPKVETAIASKIVGCMGLKLTPAQAKVLDTSNFSNPEILLLHGKYYFERDDKKAVEYCWQMLKADPDSHFVATRILRFYSASTARQALDEPRLPKLMADTEKRFPEDMDLAALRGMVYLNKFEFRKAEALLKPVVQKDPKMTGAHEALLQVAQWRGNADLALREAKAMTSLWPTSAACHADLACAYQVAAGSARHGHYFGDMSSSMERDWRANSKSAFREAYIAVQLDRNCNSGWYTILYVSRELGYDEHAKKAFDEMVRINPKNITAYKSYAFNFSPQWGGTWQQQERSSLWPRSLWVKTQAIFTC